jgi:hypothetical protein
VESLIALSQFVPVALRHWGMRRENPVDEREEEKEPADDQGDFQHLAKASAFR